MRKRTCSATSSLDLSAFLDAVELSLDILIERQRLMGRQDLPYFLTGFFEQCGPAGSLPGLEGVVPANLGDVNITINESRNSGGLSHKMAPPSDAVNHVL